ncbi:hypothetical protein L596_005595 [Steinernema carpocapsae]|uniref:Uncharacterized protein n=1 Tax=Steinernema carpocapsae TaxID=34508 RepID=A0A4U8V3J0_STECR|nr:hypothetical protein L596_005595 [Steinernema carpocapsae]
MLRYACLIVVRSSILIAFYFACVPLALPSGATLDGTTKRIFWDRANFALEGGSHARSGFRNYVKMQRLTPQFWWDYDMQDMPLPVFRAVLKKQFTKNANLTDLRVIDRKVAETHQMSFCVSQYLRRCKIDLTCEGAAFRT